MLAPSAFASQSETTRKVATNAANHSSGSEARHRPWAHNIVVRNIHSSGGHNHSSTYDGRRIDKVRTSRQYSERVKQQASFVLEL
jgi:flagellar basal body rod protein FlgC